MIRPSVVLIFMLIVSGALSGCLIPRLAGAGDTTEVRLAPGTYTYVPEAPNREWINITMEANGDFELEIRERDMLLRHHYRANESLLLHEDRNGPTFTPGISYYTGVTDFLVSVDSIFTMWLASDGGRTFHEDGAFSRVLSSTNGSDTTFSFLPSTVKYTLKFDDGVFPPKTLLGQRDGHNATWTRTGDRVGSTVPVPPAQPTWTSGAQPRERIPSADTTALIGRNLADVAEEALRNPVVLAFTQANRDWYLEHAVNLPLPDGERWTLLFRAGCNWVEAQTDYQDRDPAPVTFARPRAPVCSAPAEPWPGDEGSKVPDVHAIAERFHDIWGTTGPFVKLEYWSPLESGDGFPASGTWLLEAEDPLYEGGLLSFLSSMPQSGWGIAVASHPDRAEWVR